MAVQMFYGAYEFTPVPLFSWSSDLLRDSKGSGVAITNSLDFTGHFLQTTGDNDQIDLLFTDRSSLLTALSSDMDEFKILDNSSGILSGVYPRVENLSIQEGVWADRSQYTFTLSWDEALNSSNIVDFSENWDYTENEDRRSVSLTHNMSAVGLNTATSGNNALSNAKTFVNARTGSSFQQASHPAFVAVSGSNTAYENLRTESLDTTAGSYSVTENFTLASGAYTHTQNATLSTSDGISEVSLQGEIQGLGRGDGAYTSALSGWDNEISSALASDASGVYSSLGGGATLYTATPASESISKNAFAGTLGYSYSYTDSADENIPSGVASFDINISDQQPTTLMASLPVFGRTLGNVVQDIGTSTEGTFSITGSAKGDQGYSNASLLTYCETRINAIRPLSGNYATLRLESQSVNKDTDANEISFSLSWKYTKTLSAAKVDGAVDLGS